MTELIWNGCIYTIDLTLSKKGWKGLDFLSAVEDKERDEDYISLYDV